MRLDYVVQILCSTELDKDGKPETTWAHQIQISAPKLKVKRNHKDPKSNAQVIAHQAMKIKLQEMMEPLTILGVSAATTTLLEVYNQRALDETKKQALASLAAAFGPKPIITTPDGK